ncbi:MAG: ABC transporter ATP-binding protein [Deltaproteobacteria bacterium]|nr:ABC transporter ATP-binding protein [Deltaproteobacteria bacterium]
MVELKHITKVFNRNRPDEFTALLDVSLLVRAGKVTVFKGPSGSGKTTLLSIIGAMAKPTSGRVFLEGKEITSLSERFLTEIRRRTFGFIFQQFHLIRGISAIENVMLPATTTGEKHATLRDRALRLLDLFGLSAKARSRVEWLSGGEVQRVAIARALVNNPAVIIADEPTAHLDTRLSMDFLGIMERLNAEGKTIIIASHDPLVYESGMVSRVVEMRDGEIRGPRQSA